MGKGDFSPRFGLAYRASDTMVIRGGYGINYDPYPLAFVRDLLGNYPSSINLTVTSPNAFQFAGRLADGIPAVQVPDISSGVIPVPANIGARTLDQKPKRGYIHSFNVTVQKELPWGFTGQAGYVGTRQRNINQILESECGTGAGARRRRAAVLRQLPQDRRNGAADQRRLERLRRAADVIAAPVLAGLPDERRLHLVEGLRHLLRPARPTIRRRSRRWTISI